jgi:hypothetical protein
MKKFEGRRIDIRVMRKREDGRISYVGRDSLKEDGRSGVGESFPLSAVWSKDFSP